ncbi:MAG TPA: hypothetical protein VMD48_03280 [Solirubrobacteraceae bacterium]|nr:hypothetical protein [Solirubrobacteraceae bacterium]
MTEYPHDGDLGLSPTPERYPAEEFDHIPHNDDRPSRKQLAYLRALAMRTGQTFAYPATSAAASREIRRLKALAPSDRVEREIERHDWAAEAAAREVNCDVPITSSELTGFGAQCSWSRRS